MLKGAAKDVERLPNEAKIDCYKLSLLPVKVWVDLLLRTSHDGRRS